MTPRTRLLLFGLACIIALAVPVVYRGLARERPPAAPPSAAAHTALDYLPAGQRGVLFRSTGTGRIVRQGRVRPD